MNREVFFIDFKEDLASVELVNLKAKLVAIQPCAQVFLKKNNKKYINTLPFFGKEGHKSVLDKSTEIIDKLRNEIIINDKHGICSTYETAFFTHLRFHLHYWLVHLYMIDKVIVKYKPSKVISSSPNPSRLFNLGVNGINNNDKLLGDVVSAYCISHNLHHKVVHTSNKTISNSRVKLKSFIGLCVFEIMLYLYKHLIDCKVLFISPNDSHNMTELVSKVKAKFKKSTWVYLFSPNFSNKDLFRRLIQRKLWTFFTLSNTFFIGKSSIHKDLNAKIQRISGIMSTNPDIFEFSGVDLAPCLNRYIKNGLFWDMLKLESQINSVSRVLDAHKPKFIFSASSLGVTYALGELCSKKNIPSMLISHGSHVPHKDAYAKTEWDEHAKLLINTHYQYVALQTPWAKRFTDDMQNLKSTPVVTGPLILSRSRGGKCSSGREDLLPEHKNKTIIIHASTPKARQSIRPWVYETVDEYISNINHLIQTVEKLDDFYIIVRFRPSWTLTLSIFRRLLIPSDCYGIYEDGKFLDYLLLSDLLVSYSSTTIEEAFQHRIPVLQFDPDDKYCHIPSSQVIRKNSKNLISSSYYAGNTSSLGYTLEWIRNNHLRNKNLPKNIWNKHIFSSIEDFEWLDKVGL